jgi:hypothetical protein
MALSAESRTFKHRPTSKGPGRIAGVGARCKGWHEAGEHQRRIGNLLMEHLHKSFHAHP